MVEHEKYELLLIAFTPGIPRSCMVKDYVI